MQHIGRSVQDVALVVSLRILLAQALCAKGMKGLGFGVKKKGGLLKAAALVKTRDGYDVRETWHFRIR